MMADNNATGNVTVTAAAAESTWSPANTSLAAATGSAVGDNDELFVEQIIVAKVAGLLSAMGSAYIIHSMVFKEQKKLKKRRTFDRLLLCLCVSDFIASMSYFLASW